jgi:hypothetical protein
MVEVLALFSAAKAAHSAIKEVVEFVKEAKATGKDIGDIAGDIASHLGAFFSASQSLAKAEVEEQKKPLSTDRPVEIVVMERIQRRKQLQQMETDLRQMIVWEMNEGGLWEEFQRERVKYLKQLANEAEIEKKVDWRRLSVAVKWLKNTRLGQQSQLQLLYF